eukprot:4395277-Prymnesium_polylepis.1
MSSALAALRAAADALRDSPILETAEAATATALRDEIAAFLARRSAPPAARRARLALARRDRRAQAQARRPSAGDAVA